MRRVRGMPRVTRWAVPRLAKALAGFGIWVSALIAIPAVLAGYIGYRQMTPDAGRLDSLYSALQLLGANGGSTPDGVRTPLLLTAGRLLGVVVALSTLAFIVLRLGASSISRMVASGLRRHRLVIGGGAFAEVLVAESNPRAVTVLAGELDAEAANDLRRTGAIVVRAGAGALPRSFIRGAAEIIIAEQHDLDAEARLAEVREAAMSHRAPPKVCVVVNTAAMARTLRNKALAQRDYSTSVASVSEIIAHRLIARHPPTADRTRRELIVIGAGELPLDIVITAVNQYAIDGHGWTIHAVGARGEAWLDAVQRRATHANTHVEIHHLVVDPALISDDIAGLCTPARGRMKPAPLVLIAGLPDPAAVAARDELTRGLPDASVVVVLDHAPRRRSTASSNVDELRIRELLTDPEAMDSSPVALLAVQCRRYIERHGGDVRRDAPDDASARIGTGSAPLLRARAEALADGDDGVRPAAAELFELVTTSGGQVRAVSIVPPHPDARLGAVRTRLRASIISAYASQLEPTGRIPTRSVSILISEVARMMGRVGLVIEPDPQFLWRTNMDEALIDRLAQAIHAQYRRSFAATGNPTQSRLADLDWAGLEESDRESSRAQAVGIEEKLSLLGLDLVELGSAGSSDLDVPADALEELAELEHDRWWAHKVETGWVLGDERDPANKVHELLKPYDQLTDGQQQLDRDPILEMPGLLRDAGLAVRPAD